MYCFEEQDFSESDLPIDVSFKELREWLQDRFFVPKDLSAKMESLRSMKRQGVEDLQKQKYYDSSLAFGEFGYAECQIVFERIKARETKGNFLLFKMTSKVHKLWSRIVDFYATHNLHLVESVSSLVNVCGFEIPAFEREIKQRRSRVRALGSEKKGLVVLQRKNEKELAEKCAFYNVDNPKAYEAELEKQFASLPSRFRAVLEGIQSEGEMFGRIIEYYFTFVKKVTKQDPITSFDSLRTLRSVLSETPPKKKLVGEGEEEFEFESTNFDFNELKDDLTNELHELSSFYKRRSEVEQRAGLIAKALEVISTALHSIAGIDEWIMLDKSLSFRRRILGEFESFFVRREEFGAKVAAIERRIRMEIDEIERLGVVVKTLEKRVVESKNYLEMVSLLKTKIIHEFFYFQRKLKNF